MSHRAAVLVIAAAMATVSSPSLAKDGDLTVDLSVRVRGEAISGQFRPTAAADDAGLFIRTNLTLNYDAGPVRLVGEIMDSRAYLTHSQSSIGTAEVNAAEPVQAYLQTDFNDRIRGQFGRFTMDLGSRRLIARAGFRNTTNAFTGTRFDLTARAGDQLTLFYMVPQARLPDDRADISSNAVRLDREAANVRFFGASATSRPVHGTTIQAYLLRLAEQDNATALTRNRRLWVPGIRINKNPARGRTDFEVEGIWQGGTTRATTAPNDLADHPVSAWAVHAQVGHSVPARWTPRVTVAVDYGSGDRPGGTQTRFDSLFGARAFDFGPTGLFGAASRQNSLSVQARLDVTPGKRWDGYLAVRPQWLAEPRDSFAATGVRDPAGISGRYAGTQVDARLRYWLIPNHARLSSGYAHIFKGGFLSNAPNAPPTGNTHYGFVELTLTK